MNNVIVEDRGERNHIKMDFNNPGHRNVKIIVNGNGNHIVISSSAKLINQTITINTDQNTIHIGDNSKISGVIDFINDRNHLVIGEDTTIVSAKFYLSEGRTITVGNGCLFSWEILFRTSDQHSIIDLDTRLRINPAADIVIGDKVWISAQTWILKGSQIPSGCIVGARSMITKKFDKYDCLIVGSPAKIIKEGVSWKKELVPMDEQQF